MQESGFRDPKKTRRRLRRRGLALLGQGHESSLFARARGLFCSCPCWVTGGVGTGKSVPAELKGQQRKADIHFFRAQPRVFAGHELFEVEVQLLLGHVQQVVNPTCPHGQLLLASFFAALATHAAQSAARVHFHYMERKCSTQTTVWHGSSDGD